MISSLALGLLLALAPQGPAHAGLHPAEADLYLELVEVQRTLQVLDKAPLVRFLRDDKVKVLFEKLGQPLDRPLGELVQGILDGALEGAGSTEWLAGLATISASLAPTPGGPEPVGVLVLADFAAAEQAAAFHAGVRASFAQHEPVEGSLAGLERLVPAEGAGREFWIVTLGTRVALGTRASKPEDVPARAEGKQGGLAKHEPFAKRLAGLASASGTPLLWFALARPLSEVTQALGESAGPSLEVIERAPESLNVFAHPCVARITMAGERIVSEMITSEPAGPSDRPIDLAWLAPVPSDSMLFFASAFDGVAAAKRLREILASDEQAAAALAAIEQKLGYGPERLLSRLGPGLTFYAAAPGGLGLPDSRLWIDCEDPAAFASEFEALITAMGELLPGYQAKTKPYKVKVQGSDERLEVPITTLTLPPDAVQIPMVSISPSFAPVGKRLVFSFGSMEVKSELKRVHSGDGEPIQADANPLAARGFALPEKAATVVVMDWGKLFSGVIGTAKAFASMASPEDLPFDLALLPTPELLRQYFQPTFYYSKPIEGGTYRRNEASFGPETWFGLTGAIAFGIRQQAMLGGAAAPATIDGGK
ncbi:MAG TPA: hypothetical protein VF530_00715 [Planctomycetota bacterium]